MDQVLVTGIGGYVGLHVARALLSVVHFREIALALAAAFPHRRIPTRALPNWLVRLVALFDPTLRGLLPQLGHRYTIDSSQARRVLGFAPRPLEQTLLDTARSLEAHGLLA